MKTHTYTKNKIKGASQLSILVSNVPLSKGTKDVYEFQLSNQTPGRVNGGKFGQFPSLLGFPPMRTHSEPKASARRG